MLIAFLFDPFSVNLSKHAGLFLVELLLFVFEPLYHFDD